jgi:hypothetical protein
MRQDWESIDSNDPRVQIILLASRVETLGKEKEALERELEKEDLKIQALEERVLKMENSFQRGAGILLVLPFIGTAIGLVLAYGKTIFAPWTGKP